MPALTSTSPEQQQQKAAQQRLTQGRANEFISLHQAATRRDRAAAVQALQAFKVSPVTDAVCTLTASFVSGPDSYFPHVEAFADRPVSSADVMFIADVMADSPLSLDVKQRSLNYVLQMLISRNEPAFFPSWISIWKKAHLPEKINRLEADPPTDNALESNPCGSVTSQELGLSVQRWGKHAIHQLLDNGLGFAPSQHQLVLCVFRRT